MSENNDIIEYIVQCLLTNRDQNKRVSKPLKGDSYLLNVNSSDLLNHNIQYIIQDKFISGLEAGYNEYTVNTEFLNFKF